MTNVTPIRPDSTARLIEQLQRVADNTDYPPRSSGGGGPTLEARVAKLEATIEHVQRDVAEIKVILRGHDGKFDGLRDRMERDFRLLFGVIITVALGLAGLMAKGFHWF